MLTQDSVSDGIFAGFRRCGKTFRLLDDALAVDKESMKIAATTGLGFKGSPVEAPVHGADVDDAIGLLKGPLLGGPTLARVAEDAGILREADDFGVKGARREEGTDGQDKSW